MVFAVFSAALWPRVAQHQFLFPRDRVLQGGRVRLRRACYILCTVSWVGLRILHAVYAFSAGWPMLWCGARSGLLAVLNALSCYGFGLSMYARDAEEMV